MHLTPASQPRPNKWLESLGISVEPVEINDEGIEVYPYMHLGWHPELQRRVNADEGPNGAPERRGEWTKAPAGRHAEVLKYEPVFKQAFIHIPLRLSSKLMPHYLEGWVNLSDLDFLPEARTPFKTRRFP